MMQVSTQGSLDALKDAFSGDDQARCITLTLALPSGDDHGTHPLSSLLPLAEQNDRREALIALVDEAARAAPLNICLLELRGTLLMQIGRLGEAVASLREALNRRPRHLPALNLLACALTQAGEFAEARQVLAQIFALDPKDPSSLSNIAYLTAASGDVDEAINLYRKAILIKPDHPQIRLNYSIALLKGGYFQQGWAEHEWRFQLPGHTSLPSSRLLPNMTANLDLKGKHVLVTHEEGYGDAFMYLRFVPLLAEKGAIVRVWGADTMADLMARVVGVETVQVGGETPPYDFHCPFISLPRAFAASAHPFGVSPPYITTDPAKSARFRDRLQSDRKLRVGLVWAGEPRRHHSDFYMIDQRRSMPLDALSPLFGMENVTFYSLQKGEAAQQLQVIESGIIDLMPEIATMDDTAALIDQLDMVVSVDTSMVHLAGGMGKPVLLMDRVNPCWRWMTDREDSPWYPTLRILRQTKPWDWSDVVSSVGQILREAARQKTS